MLKASEVMQAVTRPVVDMNNLEKCMEYIEKIILEEAALGNTYVCIAIASEYFKMHERLVELLPLYGYTIGTGHGSLATGHYCPKDGRLGACHLIHINWSTEEGSILDKGIVNWTKRL